jgi:hypothetical protein
MLVISCMSPGTNTVLETFNIHHKINVYGVLVSVVMLNVPNTVYMYISYISYMSPGTNTILETFNVTK